MCALETFKSIAFGFIKLHARESFCSNICFSPLFFFLLYFYISFLLAGFFFIVVVVVVGGRGGGVGKFNLSFLSMIDRWTFATTTPSRHYTRFIVHFILTCNFIWNYYVIYLFFFLFPVPFVQTEGRNGACSAQYSVSHLLITGHVYSFYISHLFNIKTA